MRVLTDAHKDGRVDTARHVIEGVLPDDEAVYPSLVSDWPAGSSVDTTEFVPP